MENYKTFHIRATLSKTGDGFVASFDPWNAHGQGETKKEAIHGLIHALQSVVEITMEKGTFEEAVKVLDAHMRETRHHKHHQARRHHAVQCLRDIILPIPMSAICYAHA